ncbi:ankyrin-like protein [Vaccinia virus]|uniref:Ankyrin-like protein n=1 Tax=Vaccinia virus TaxID=10245 RepID=A0A0A1CRJ6_VACCV|nr:ankyrin-like protein [Vaccinia virus]AIX99536.1 ankyrin-like protein [Vaccinia virus]
MTLVNHPIYCCVILALNILRYLLDRFDIQKDEYYNTAFQNCNNNVASYIGYDINLPTKDGIRLGV